jgi:hypothetical protein
MNHCMDCQKPLKSYKSKRCRVCAGLERMISNRARKEKKINEKILLSGCLC